MSAADWMAGPKAEQTYPCERCDKPIEGYLIWTLRYEESEIGHCLPWYCEACREELAEATNPETGGD